MKKTTQTFQFETALKELETIVHKMETETLTLEESLANFEQGIALTKACQKALVEAEQKIKIISQQQMQAEGNQETGKSIDLTSA